MVVERLVGDPGRSLARMGFGGPTALGIEMCGIRRAFRAQRGSSYKWVWFHDVLRLAACRDLLRPQQRVILQAHSPELPSREFAAAKANDVDMEWVTRAEQWAFQRAEVCVFPTPGAVSAAGSLIPAGKRIEYLLSGSHRLVPRTSLPLDPAFVYYLYVGRCLPIKGYDIVLAAFARAHQIDSRLRLVLLGDGTPETAPGVIDLGRVDDPAQWIAASDYLVSANRVSYFDLAVMEALSVGTPVILTTTGGHDWFESVTSPGVFTVASADPVQLADAMLANRVKRDRNVSAVQSNLDLYSAEFDREQYQKRLTRFFEHLL